MAVKISGMMGTEAWAFGERTSTLPVIQFARIRFALLLVEHSEVHHELVV